ncbi:YaiI/YqxD family protein [Macrococcus hajekii]|uniref:UPF0178 protein ERX37_08550 n=1 Tax=Macrococcus hajekii TaxID=198482 RepID=A0A4V3BDV2_9STAP|nr:YaiI/YqxD family protein [Macrococcus hajekii]TDM01534.1 YaiI/YqxD family protein [Macrococcus hajekii]GGB00803.1 UPF0178 protein [Macrococcus hajekii]
MLIVDADACPVIDEIIDIAGQYQLNVILVRNFNHFTSRQYPSFVTLDYVDDGFDSADYRIVQLASKQDIVITQDYGLASLLLNKQVTVLHHTGSIYSQDNIEYLLMVRHSSQQMRRARHKTKGPKALTEADRQHFCQQLEKTIRNQ